jgi:Putative adhesin
MSGFGWHVVGGAFALCTVAWAGFNTVTLLAHEERTEITTYDAASVRAIDVDNSAGSVTIHGSSERDEITVTARISEGLRTTGERQELSGDQLELQASCPVFGGDWCRVSYTIEAPADLDVRVDTDNGRIEVLGLDGLVDLDADNGGVEVVDVTGDLTIAGDNGSITASELASGTVVAETDNGSLTLEFVEPPSSVEARSDNGSVEVVVPDSEVAYRLDVTTDNGDVSDNIRTNPDSDRSILAETDNGDATVRYGS